MNIEKINNIANELVKKIDDNFYVNFKKIPPKSLFMYIIILVLCVTISRYIKIGINNILGIVIGITIIYYFYQKDTINSISETDQLDIKYNTIIPKPKNFVKYPEIIEFFFSIREYYKVNPKIFSELVYSVDAFLNIYQDIKNGVENCKQNYDVAYDLMRSSLNNLHSIIYSIEPKKNKIIKNKLIQANQELMKILYKYLEEMINNCNIDIETNGYDVNKIPIEKFAPNAYNLYSNTNNTFYSDLY
jgi:hypothetical protein